MDVPKASLDMITRFWRGEPFVEPPTTTPTRGPGGAWRLRGRAAEQ